MAEKAYYLNEADRKKLQEWDRIIRNLPQNQSAVRPPDQQGVTPDVHIAKSPGIIQPMTAVAGTGTGSSFAPGVGANCDIYSIDLDTGLLVLRPNLAKTVYNLSKTAVPAGWIVIHKNKFGQWVCGLGASTSGSTAGQTSGGCICFNCVTADLATVFACPAAVDGALFSYVVDTGVWNAFPTLSGIQTLIWDSGCLWTSAPIDINLGTGTGTAQEGLYQWQLIMAGTGGLDSTLELVLISGYDVARIYG